MNRAYRTRRAVNLAHQDAELVEFAKRIGHHGVQDFIESVRQRLHMPITAEYAKDVLSRGGFPNPKA